MLPNNCGVLELKFSLSKFPTLKQTSERGSLGYSEKRRATELPDYHNEAPNPHILTNYYQPRQVSEMYVNYAERAAA